jgi:hypothetical protein
VASRHHCLAFLLHRLGNPIASTGFNTVAPTANSIPSLCAYQEPKLFRLSHTSEPEVLDKAYHGGLACGVAFIYQHKAGSPPAPLDR